MPYKCQSFGVSELVYLTAQNNETEILLAVLSLIDVTFVFHSVIVFFFSDFYCCRWKSVVAVMLAHLIVYMCDNCIWNCVHNPRKLIQILHLCNDFCAMVLSHE